MKAHPGCVASPNQHCRQRAGDAQLYADEYWLACFAHQKMELISKIDFVTEFIEGQLSALLPVTN